jgi:curli biogenesis system outer membrane secretion channel CsgG
MVALDLRLVDGQTGRIVSAFKSNGTFSSASAESGFSLFGIGSQEHKFAQSVLGQAIRAALNDASLKINQALGSRRI